MDKAKLLNLCRIFHRQTDGEGKTILGCGCVVKCSNQSLKIATSKKIRKMEGGEVFATFEAIQDKEIKLQVDMKEESGIAYLSFDETVFEHRPEGIPMGDLGRIDIITYRVPVFDKLEQLHVSTSEIKLYNVVEDPTRCTLQIQTGNNNRVISNLRESDKFHLVVRGAPILDDRFEFFGIVDFLEVDRKSLLELVKRTPTEVIRSQPTGYVNAAPRVPGPGSQVEAVDTEVNIKCSCGTFDFRRSWLSSNRHFESENAHTGSKLKALKDIVQKVVLPIGACLLDIIFGSVTFVVRVTNLTALDELWKRYKEGKMKQDFAEIFFNISEMKDQANVDQSAELIVEISENEYRKAKDQLTISQTTDGLPTPAAGGSQDSQQETTDGGRNKFSTDDHLQLIWNYIDFRDRFSNVLNVKYTRLKYWPHLAEQFDIKWAIYDAFSMSDINSPTERLLEYFECTDPKYKVKDFVQDCKKADAYEVSRIVEESVKTGILDNKDLVSKICDKAPRVLDEVVLKLDRESRLWKNLAVVKNVLKKEYSTFESDRTTNPARSFFDVLRTQGPEITIGEFKKKSEEMKNISQILEDFGIEDEMLLKDLSKEFPGAKSEIESFLNNLKTDSLWNLATQYQQEGLMKDIDVETAFRQEEDCHSPTKKVMDYVLASSPKKYTIEDLIVKLWNINRKDCFDILQPYLKGGKDDIDKITKGLKRLQPEERLKKQPCTGDESVSSTPVSDNSEESQNQYLTTISAKK